MPKSVASQLQSSNLEFIDVIEYDPAAIAAPPYRIFIRTQSPFLGDKLDVRMTMTIEEAEGGAACRQVGAGQGPTGAGGGDACIVCAAAQHPLHLSLTPHHPHASHRCRRWRAT